MTGEGKSEPNMTGEDRQCDDWKPCPLGLLVQAARGDRAKVSRRKLLRAGGTAAAVLLGGSLGWRAWRSSHQEDGATGTEVVARMTCDEAIPLIPTLVANELPEATRRRVEAHLAHCPHCASLRNDLRPKA